MELEMESAKQTLVITTSPGIEDILAREIQNLLKPSRIWERPFGILGRVLVETDSISSSDIRKLVDGCWTADRILLMLANGEVSRTREGLREIYKIVRSSGLERFITPSTSFAIRPERFGNHEYKSLDIARVSGDAVIDYIREVFGERPPVNLDYPNIVVRVEVIGDHCFVYLDLTGDRSLHRRGYRVYDHPASLKPSLAHAMFEISNLEKAESLLDPMCGGGTIPIEAARRFPNLRILAFEKFRRHILGAIMNSLAAGVYDRIIFDQRDSTRLEGFEVDRIIVNPPYGIRIARKGVIHSLYSGFLDSCERVLSSGGLLCAITTEHNLFKELALERGFELMHEREVHHGGLRPHILLLRWEG